MKWRRVLLAAPLLALAATAETPSEQALEDGNRLFRQGQVEEALTAYKGGYRGAEPLLAYNLGTAAHQLGRLPEALLWYRRALVDTGAADPDPWLLDNLSAVRGQLGAPPVPLPTRWAVLADHRRLWSGLLLALSWAAVTLALAAHRRRGHRGLARAADAVTVAAAVVTLAVLAVRWATPWPAVLLAPCGPEGELPAGSEVWVRPGTTIHRVMRAGAPPLPCNAEAVGLVSERKTGFLLP
jgi:hypothetical protein